VPIESIMIGEHAPCESLADDNDGLFTFLAVELVEITAGKEGNAERGKESGRDDAHLGAGVLSGVMNMTVGRELEAEAVSRQGTTMPKAVLFTPGSASMRRIDSL